MRKISEKGYIVEEIGDGVYRIEEFGAADCYLIIGQEKALLIDMGIGLGDLKGLIEQITPLPIIAAATHGHTDHIGGRGQFEYLYLNPFDYRQLKYTGGKTVRKLFLAVNPEAKRRGAKYRNMTKKKFNTKILPLEDGHIFDLGGRCVKTIAASGHTKGSVIFVDEEAKMIFAGDNVCTMLWLFLPGSLSVEGWLASAQKILELSKDYKVYGGHGGERKGEELSSLIDKGRELTLKGNAAFSKIKGFPCLRETDCIVYRTGNVRIKMSYKKSTTE